jgi:Bacterial toxin homologue of phage lysozyme, C-term
MAESIDWDFIASLEGKGVTTGYVPDAAGSNSGVTIATGFDLGQRNETDLTNLGLSSGLVTKLKPYLGKKGKTAADFLKDNPLTVTETEAAEIDKAVKSQNVPALKQKYLNSSDNTANVIFDDLPSQAQTVIASVSFQYGDLSSKAPKFWTAATSQNWEETVKILRNFQDKYPTRRNKEADLLDQIIKHEESLWKLLPIIGWWFVFLIIFAGVACEKGLTQTKTIIYDEKLAAAYKNYDASIAQKRQKLEFESGAGVSNCTEYWRESEKSEIKEEVANMLYSSEYMTCDALKILKKSAGSDKVSSESKSKTNYGQEIYSRLDLKSFPSSLGPRLDDKATFENQKEEMLPKIKPLAVVSNIKDWNFAVSVIAETDVNNNQKTDLIVWIVDEAKEGNYRSYSTYIIYDVENQGLLKARKLQ